MPGKVKPVPEGYHTITPGIAVHDATRAIDFYKRAFNAKERGERMTMPDGKIGHVELQIGDSILMLSDEFPQGCPSPQTLGGTTFSLNLYVEDVDSAFKQAIDAGGTVLMPVADMFWGDRYGKLQDPFGHQWGILTHKQDLTAEQMRKAGETAMAEMRKQTERAQHGD